MRWRAAIAAAAALAVAVPARADDEPTIMPMRFTEHGKVLEVTTILSKLFDMETYEALERGFQSTIVVRMWLYRRDTQEPVGFQILQRSIIYDLWDEIYQVRLEGPGGVRVVKVKYRAEVLKLVTAIDAVPVAMLRDVPYDGVELAIVAELNPVSRETLAEVRRWLTQGAGGGLDRGGSFFGSVVSVFVNPKLAEADRVLRLRSKPYYRRKP